MDFEGSAHLAASYVMSRADIIMVTISGTKLDSRKVITFIAREGKALRYHILIVSYFRNIL
ncbi:hypothetical protein [Bartonella bacilliformis]|uniref:hypothetical protein n=1 Tax=Bartonella bacilliformis TaxID=774 RepID=UPI000AC56833|nr:hypothetical protein [Bartonella bacilliformis]